ncbi:MAG: hypothetical protein WCW16_00595 [Candidatus Magasanikbacteria bacterium]
MDNKEVDNLLPEQNIPSEIPQPVFQPDTFVNAPQKQETQQPQSEQNPQPAENQEQLPQREMPQNVEIQQEQTIDDRISSLKQKLRLKKKKITQIPRVRDELTVRVEEVMQEGLADAYRELTPIQQQEFKIKGEETAWQIRQLLKETHIKIKEIFRLLLEWLKMLPGINRFFLEQEAKIKADKIITLKEFHQDK